jgi:hypothetical protein
MSSRALRRLQKEEPVIKVGKRREESSEEGEDDLPGFSSSKVKKKTSTLNPFAAVSRFPGVMRRYGWPYSVCA